MRRSRDERIAQEACARHSNVTATGREPTGPQRGGRWSLPQVGVERTPREADNSRTPALRRHLLRAGAHLAASEPVPRYRHGGDEDEAGVQSIGGSDVASVTPGNSFELIARAS